jgi:hypothetical protein
MRSRGWLIRAAGAGIVVLGVAAPLLGRVAWEGQAELREADAAGERGRVDLEIVHLGRAARWRSPVSGHDEAALDRLMSIAWEARERGDSQTALLAHREVRGALLATRGWSSLDEGLYHAVNGEIAAAMAAQERVFGTDLSGSGEAEAYHLALLEQARPVASPWAVVASLAIVTAVLGLVIGVTDRGVARRALVVLGALALVLAAVAWALRAG